MYVLLLLPSGLLVDTSIFRALDRGTRLGITQANLRKSWINLSRYYASG